MSEAPLRLGVDLTPLARGAAGIGSYVRGLLGARTAFGADVQLRGWVNRPALARPRLDGVDLTGVRVAHTRVPRRLLNQLWLARAVGGIEDFTGPLDVFHATDLLAPRARAAQVVLSVHDLAWRDEPAGVAAPLREFLARWFAASLAQAAAVLTPSRATARALARHFPELACPVHVVPYGVDAAFRAERAAGDGEVRARHGLPADYVLYVGALDRRKGVEALVPAAAALAELRGDAPPFVIVGPDAGSLATIREQTAGAAVRVHLAGAVARADLPAIYRGARAFVFPSHHEGFGLPVLEAAACGVPVACTAIPALEELASAFAKRVSAPAKPRALAKALDALLREDPRERERRVRAGRARAAELTWERCAAATADVYRAVRCAR